MAIPNPEDPFLAAQEDLLNSLRTTQSLHASYFRIRSLTSSAISPELTQARQELESALQDLAADLQDLIDSVTAVEGDPFRYGLDVEEVGRRRQLVKQVGDEVEEMREQIQKNRPGPTGTTIGAGDSVKTANGALPSPSAFDDDALVGQRGRAEYAGDGDDYGAFEQQRQVEMMQEQDEQLDGVFKTVGNLRAQADTMGRELEEQAGMIEDVDNVADRVGGKLQSGIKKVGHVIKNNEETWSSCCIGVLILVLILLLILVIIL